MYVYRLDYCQLPFEFFFTFHLGIVRYNISEIFKFSNFHHTYTRVYRRFSFDFELSCTDVIFQEYIMMHSFHVKLRIIADFQKIRFIVRNLIIL